MKRFLGSAIMAVVLAAAPSAVSAGELKLSLNNGRATVIATDVPLNQILSEWARVGKTTIVNGDKLTGPPVTVVLEDVPEQEALAVLLRSASGYIVASRSDVVANASAFDRILIMPTSRAPAATAVNVAAPPRFPARPMPQQMEPDVDDDPPVEPVVLPQGEPGDAPATQPQSTPGIPPDQQGAPMTAPRPGMLPAPPPGQAQPYNAPQQFPLPVQPGLRRPPRGGGGGDSQQQ
jgi:hypothetical protein